jgi:hypothetical protein
MTNNERRAVFNTTLEKHFYRRALEFAHNQTINDKQGESVTSKQKSRMALYLTMRDIPYAVICNRLFGGWLLIPGSPQV